MKTVTRRVRSLGSPELFEALEPRALLAVAMVSVSAADAAAAESGGTANPGAIMIKRSGPTTQPLTVMVGIAGSAMSGVDYAALQGVTDGMLVVIPAGMSSVRIPVTIVNDSDVENDETVTLTILADAAYQFNATRATATVTIKDNEPTITVRATGASTAESTPARRPGQFTIARAGTDRSQPVVVTYTISGTAAASDDYAPLTGTVVIPAGAASAIVTVESVDDATAETAETVILTLAPGVDYRLGATTTATVTIADNEPTVTITKGRQANEGNAAAQGGTFIVTRKGGSTALPLTVHYELAGTSTAQPVDDFAALSGSVTIPAGMTTATIALVPVQDTLAEPTETVTLALIGSDAYRLSTTTTGLLATVNILNFARYRFFELTNFNTPQSANYAFSATARITGEPTETVSGTLRVSTSTVGSRSTVSSTILTQSGTADLEIPTLTYENRSDGVYVVDIGDSFASGLLGTSATAQLDLPDLRVAPQTITGPASASGPFSIDVSANDVSVSATGTITVTAPAITTQRITVPAGTFDAVKVTQSIQLTARGMGTVDGETVSFTLSLGLSVSYFVAPGLGLVRLGFDITGSASGGGERVTLSARGEANRL